MAKLNKNLVEACKKKLLETKEELLNRVRNARESLSKSQEARGGDEGDQTLRVLAEADFLSMNERFRVQLTEIEIALSRIENGTYGICEETEEFIEPERLSAIPWTRLSIEGAEIREGLEKKYAR